MVNMNSLFIWIFKRRFIEKVYVLHRILWDVTFQNIYIFHTSWSKLKEVLLKFHRLQFRWIRKRPKKDRKGLYHHQQVRSIFQPMHILYQNYPTKQRKVRLSFHLNLIKIIKISTQIDQTAYFQKFKSTNISISYPYVSFYHLN